MTTRTDGSGTSRILTLVFTDLADSTALKTRRGDQAVGELITRHRAHVQRLAAESGGRIIDWAGDGCFLTCETPSAAVLFALRLQQAHGDEPDLPGVRPNHEETCYECSDDYRVKRQSRSANSAPCLGCV